MKRRGKKEEQPAPDEPVQPEAPPQPTVDPTAERLAPIEEQQKKADLWMKDASAQLSRVASHVQADEKRQERLESRLAEFEERIQGMLTLTETLSMSDNPFVRRGPAPPSPQPEDEAPPVERVVVPVAPDKEESDGATQDAPSPPSQAVQKADASPAGPKEPSEDTMVLMDELVPARPKRVGHPNDPSQDDAPEEDLEALLIQEPEDNPFLAGDEDASAERAYAPPPADAPSSHPFPETDASSAARRRLTLLQWAALLARHLRRLDIEEFLETYLHTGWIDRDDVHQVRVLAADLARHERVGSERMSREDLHVRTIIILSSLQAGAPAEPQRAAQLVEEARDLANAPWLRPER